MGKVFHFGQDRSLISQLMKNEFATLFYKYVLKNLFALVSLDVRFEPTWTKTPLNILAM